MKETLDKKKPRLLLRIGLAALILVIGVLVFLSASDLHGALEILGDDPPSQPILSLAEDGTLREQILRFALLWHPLLSLIVVGLVLWGWLLTTGRRRFLLAWALITEVFLGLILYFLAHVPFLVQEPDPFYGGYTRQEAWHAASLLRWLPFYPPAWLVFHGYALRSLLLYSGLVAALATAGMFRVFRWMHAKLSGNEW